MNPQFGQTAVFGGLRKLHCGHSFGSLMPSRFSFSFVFPSLSVVWWMSVTKPSRRWLSLWSRIRQRYWASHKDEALELRKQLDGIAAKLPAKQQEDTKAEAEKEPATA